MKIAVLSDIHANLEAFEAVNDDLQSQGVGRVICLGDNIGYGPDPQQVVLRLRRHGYESVLGNHEFALFDKRARNWLNFQAAENNIETEKLLSRENKVFCCEMAQSIELGKGYFVHAFPPASVFRYLYRQPDEKIAELFDSFSACIFFLGHTHNLQLVIGDNGLISRRKLGCETVTLEPHLKYIVNCGSVGQPRDGDNRAKYLLWDCDNNQLEVRFVKYDFQKTMEKIRGCGFPEIYAKRLQ